MIAAARGRNGVMAPLLAMVLAGWSGLAAAAADPVFHWNRDALFHSLELQFDHARQQPVTAVRPEFDRWVRTLRRSMVIVGNSGSKIPASELRRIEETQFHIATLAAAHESLLPEAHALITAVRLAVGDAAHRWPAANPDVHEAVYRVLYGGRAAIEEALVQQHVHSLPTLTRLEDVASSAPSTMVAGVRVHSGDIVLSRGDAATSALIARGNTFPGNFSHVAIIHVDAGTGKATVVESLIERGAIIRSADEFLREKRFRLLLLRLRPDHPALVANPLAAHRAAEWIHDRVRTRRVPYDFSMDWNDDRRMFCSEIVHHAFRHVDIDLWMYKPRLRDPGLVRWLGDMGVREFTTLVPSDIEYDPRLAPVAEWRNADTLQQDRLDNVTLDVLLEAAARGDRLGFSGFHRLPGALAKAWSGIESAIGVTPTVPEGMSVTTVLRVRSLIKHVHPRLRAAIARRAEAYRVEHGYPPPYWTLTGLARLALVDRRQALVPWLVNGRTNGSDGNRGERPESQ